MFSVASIAIAALLVTATGYSNGNSGPQKTALSNSTLTNTSSAPITAPLQALQAHRIACVGDSITEGFAGPNNWPYHLKTRLDGDWEVIDQGVGGAKTADMLDRIDAALDLNPHFVIIMGGINDLAKGESLEIVKGNIGTMCTRVESYGAVPVLCTVTPTGDYLTQKDELNAWITQYAHSNGYPLIDFYTVLNDQSNPGHANPALVFDGTHPNPAGYAAMGDAIDLAIFTGNVQESPQQSTAAAK